MRFGMVIMATLFGMAFGGWISGVIFDATGSYSAAFANGALWNLLNLCIAVALVDTQCQADGACLNERECDGRETGRRRPFVRTAGTRERLGTAPGGRRQASRHDHDGPAPRQAGAFQYLRPGRHQAREADGAGYDLPLLLDDQAADLDCDHDAVRGRSLPARRSDHALPAVLQGHARVPSAACAASWRRCRRNATSRSAICSRTPRA